ncbi:hypothetical protein GMOD_00004626 [Pyrenophora seminiperda CCB06]|uniref:Uncharacterized protein n=1 Tax=Pyrenophora seminiperda CCB06 TaxID=1302712 RepID=A0A3M7MHK1_9PLEO|nr:hypothetical protein GMOD_00004626 [Pyrenophora seminiperda CCB06]
MSSPTIIQHPSKSDESSQLGPVFTLLPTNGSYAPMTTSAISPPFPKTSISSKTGIGSFTTRTSNGTHPIASSTLRTSVTGSPTLQTLTSLSTFQTRTRTQSSSLSTPTGPILNNVTVVTTTIVPVAATPPLSPSQTAGVALGSTAGVLLAIVAALFLVRRYHAMHAAKRASEYNPVMTTKRGTGGTPNRRAGLISFAAKGKSRESSKAYPEEAYLYDPSLGANSGRNSADVEASMSHGADGLLARRIGPLPPAPHTSFEDGHGPSIPNAQHNDLGSSLKSSEDPYLKWRSSAAIGTSKDQASALVAAITDYGAGPQKPLPPIPDTPSTYSSNNHVSPSPRLSPLVNNDCGSRHSYTRSSSRSSVSSQRSLRPLRIATSPNPASNDYPPLSPYERVSRQSLGSIIETSTHEPCMNSRESDLPLRVLGTETSDSVTVYAPIPAAQKQPRKRPALTTVFSQDSCTVAPLSIAKCVKAQTTPAKLRSRGSILFPAASNDSPYYSSLIQDLPSSPAYRDQPTTNPPVYYSLFPKPPSYLKPPQNKGWEDIKHNSNRSSIAASLPPHKPQQCAPPPHTTPSSSPPAPLKERSFLPLRRKTPLMDSYSQSSLSSHNPYAKFACKTGFEGPRMSLFAKVNSMREEDRGGLRGKMGDGDGKMNF